MVAQRDERLTDRGCRRRRGRCPRARGGGGSRMGVEFRCRNRFYSRTSAVFGYTRAARCWPPSALIAEPSPACSAAGGTRGCSSSARRGVDRSRRTLAGGWWRSRRPHREPGDLDPDATHTRSAADPDVVAAVQVSWRFAAAPVERLLHVAPHDDGDGSRRSPANQPPVALVELGVNAPAWHPGRSVGRTPGCSVRRCHRGAPPRSRCRTGQPCPRSENRSSPTGHRWPGRPPPG